METCQTVILNWPTAVVFITGMALIAFLVWIASK